MKNKLLIAIVLVAAFLRFFQIGSNPPSLTWDEVSWGYNAYALGLNGKDEFGKFLPYDYLESFGDFKPPMYAYLDILPIKILGLTEFAVRFPSALFGVLTVLTTYLLVLQIFQTSKKKKLYALLSAGILAISPWHILLSRAAFEANVATWFIVFGLYAFLRGLQEQSKFLIFSAISFALSFYTFNTPRIVVPLLLIALVVCFGKKLWKIKKQTITAAVTGLIILLPLVNFLISPQAKLRFQEVNIFSNPALVETANQQIENDNNAWWSNILHNRRVFYAREYLIHYFDNLSFEFLFIKGDGNPKFSTQDIGQMYLWELPFFIIGIFLLFRFKENNWFVIPLWLLLGIIPAATARETPHALRIETTLPTFQILIAYGLVNAAIYFKKYQKLFITSTASVALFFSIYFLHTYFITYPWEFSGEWQYGYKESLAYAQSVEKEYDQIIITSELGRPYIYYLFYAKIRPEEFQKSAIIKRDPFGFVTVEKVGKYHFGKPEVIKAKKVLRITTADEKIPSAAKMLKTFYKLDGAPVLKAYTI